VLDLGDNAAAAVVLVFGIAAIVLLLVQAVLMLFRQVALVILAGVLPLAAARYWQVRSGQAAGHRCGGGRTTALILGDAKPDYTPLVRYVGGQVIRIGRGLDKSTRSTPAARRRAAADDRAAGQPAPVGGPLPAAVAADGAATLIREDRLSNAEEVVLGRAIDLRDDRQDAQPITRLRLTPVLARSTNVRGQARDDPHRSAGPPAAR